MYVMDFVIWRHLSVNARILLNWFARNGTAFMSASVLAATASDNLLGWVAMGRNPILGERDYG
jgi:hypothetical protein